MSLNVIALGGNAILDKDPSDEGQKSSCCASSTLYCRFCRKRGKSHCLSRQWTTSRQLAVAAKSRGK